MLLLYYDIGCVINEHKAWGNKFVDEDNPWVPIFIDVFMKD